MGARIRLLTRTKLLTSDSYLPGERATPGGRGPAATTKEPVDDELTVASENQELWCWHTP